MKTDRERANRNRNYRPLIKRSMRERQTWQLQLVYEGREITIEPIRFTGQLTIIAWNGGRLVQLNTTKFRELQLVRRLRPL